MINNILRQRQRKKQILRKVRDGEGNKYLYRDRVGDRYIDIDRDIDSGKNGAGDEDIYVDRYAYK